MSKDSPKRKRPSLADVAKIAGVHKITASRVMRGVDKVSEKTKAKVLKAAEEIGYQHSPIVSTVMGHLARTRKSDHATPIALVVDNTTKSPKLRSMRDDIIARTEERANRLGFKVEVYNLFEDGLSPERLNSILLARGIQGVVINVTNQQTATINLDWEKFCIATSGGRLENCRQLSRVQSDMPQMITRITKELNNLGYRRIGYCYYGGVSDALGGLLEGAMRYHNARQSAADSVPILDTQAHTPEEFKAWVSKYEPEVVVAHDHIELKLLQEMGLDVPKDIGYASYAMPDSTSGVSGMIQYKGDLAAAALELVVNNLLYGRFGPLENPARVLLPGTWLAGETLRPL